MSLFLSVTNNGAVPFSSKFNGQEYTFSPNQKCTISADVARHIFGVGLNDKTEVLTRHGWMSHSSDMTNAMAKLDAFSFNIPNDNPDDEPVVELASLTPPVVEDETEHESALVQFGTGKEAEEPYGDEVDEPAPISTGGNILDGLKNFLK
jgi:hypothetical protein